MSNSQNNQRYLKRLVEITAHLIAPALLTSAAVGIGVVNKGFSFSADALFAVISCLIAGLLASLIIFFATQSVLVFVLPQFNVGRFWPVIASGAVFANVIAAIVSTRPFGVWVIAISGAWGICCVLPLAAKKA